MVHIVTTMFRRANFSLAVEQRRAAILVFQNLRQVGHGFVLTRQRDGNSRYTPKHGLRQLQEYQRHCEAVKA
jgi:hypothetical protein